ncbi:MAG: LuxR family transcriptional regulator [uncultured bacterium]|nr:MAG: LuxR family transcriptional regulator [uncultured bacterium]
MNGIKKIGLVGFLLLVAILTGFDVINDYRVGSSLKHVITEGIILLISIIGLFVILNEFRKTKLLNQALKLNLENTQADFKKWQEEAKAHIMGLSLAIDHQFDRWLLTAAEKEIGLLLLKGLSFKEIAEARQTSERTVRQQSIEVYRKSKLNGRAEFAAFFMEDMLTPVVNIPK